MAKDVQTGAARVPEQAAQRKRDDGKYEHVELTPNKFMSCWTRRISAMFQGSPYRIQRLSRSISGKDTAMASTRNRYLKMPG